MWLEDFRPITKILIWGCGDIQVPASFQFIVGSGSQEADMPIRTLEADGEVEHQQAPALTSVPDPHKYSVLPGFVATVPAEVGTNTLLLSSLLDSLLLWH